MKAPGPGQRPRGRPVAVIPAYNEARHIRPVLETLLAVESLDRVLVVDDASRDATSAVVRALQQHDRRLDLLRLTENQGKAGALLAGARSAQRDILLFLDADLMGLTPEHVEALVQPVLNGQASMTRGLFQGGRLHTDWSHRFFPYLSGQRCLRWRHYYDVPGLADARWGLEIAFSLHARRNDYRVQDVPLPGMTHATRGEKDEDINWVVSELQMWRDVVRYTLRHHLGPQVWEWAAGRTLAGARRKQTAKPLSK